MNTETPSSPSPCPCPATMVSIGKRLLAMCLVLTLSVAACTTNPYTGEKQASKTGIGAGVGAAGGALLGALAGGGKRKNVLIGAGIGALAGGGVGYYMDRQDNELRAQLQNTGVSVTRNGDSIILNMPGNITFATGSSNINADFYPVLNSVALVVNKYEKTYLDIVGHTDNVGSPEMNQRLSEARANSVARYLESQKVLPQRIITSGMGMNKPIANNSTPEGRAQNRRVEIVLTPLT
jgi:outer membrane protein OmpA-like peptidoglycan-associated protein